MAAWGDKETLKSTEFSCYQHDMLPALHRIAEITCQENHVMCKDTISLFVELLFIGRSCLKSTNSWCRAVLAFRTILIIISMEVNLKVIDKHC